MRIFTFLFKLDFLTFNFKPLLSNFSCAVAQK